MKVKILKCSRDAYWYADKIGEEFEIDTLPPGDFQFYKVEYVGFIDSWDTDAPIYRRAPIAIS